MRFAGHVMSAALEGLPSLSNGIFESVSCEAFASNIDGDSLNVRQMASSTARPTYNTGICLILSFNTFS